MRLFSLIASVVLVSGACAAPAAPPTPPKDPKKLPVAKRRPAPRILTLTPGQKKVTTAQLKAGRTPEQHTAGQGGAKLKPMLTKPKLAKPTLTKPGAAKPAPKSAPTKPAKKP